MSANRDVIDAVRRIAERTEEQIRELREDVPAGLVTLITNLASAVGMLADVAESHEQD